MAADLLALLARAALALSAAIIVVLVLRRPLRALFGAEIAYAFWLILTLSNHFRISLGEACCRD